MSLGNDRAYGRDYRRKDDCEQNELKNAYAAHVYRPASCCASISATIWRTTFMAWSRDMPGKRRSS